MLAQPNKLGMITGSRINIYGVFEEFYYILEIFKNFELYIYCEDKGIGNFGIIETFYGPDDSQYQIWAYLDGYCKNNFEFIRYNCFGDILITRTRWDGLPISINKCHIDDYFFN